MINFEEYEHYLIKKESAVATIRGYRIAIRQLNEFAEQNNHKELSFRLMLDYKTAMQKKYKESTLNYKIIAYSSYFNYLEGINPNFKASDFKVKRVKVQDDNEREYLTDLEYKALLRCCNHEETKMLVKLIAATGLRISEALSLTMDNIKPVKIRVTNKGKTRTIGMPDLVKNELRIMFGKKKPNEPMFSFSQTTYRNHLKVSAKFADVNQEKVYPHAFRHFFAKDFLEKHNGERALGKLKRILGHSNIATTMIYLEYNNTEIAELMMAS